MTETEEKALKLLKEYDVGLNADCAEWVDSNNKADLSAGLLACGSYQLNEADQSRSGQILIYRLVNTSACSPDDSNAEPLKLTCALRGLPGIFDLKWSTIDDTYYLASASSDGKLHVYVYDENSEVLNRRLSVDVVKNNDSGFSAFCLSCDWKNKLSRTENELIATKSDGTISEVSLDQATVKQTWKAHVYPFTDDPAEIWCCAYNMWNVNIVASGGDEGWMKIWDLRTNMAKAIHTDKTSHEAGVCSLQFHHLIEHRFVSGSYDNHIRVWDIRSLRNPIAEPFSGDGGVWRLKWHMQESDLLLAACMRGGFKILKLDNDTHRIRLVSTSVKKSSGPWEPLAYGTDWTAPSGANKISYVFGASFYDKKLRVYSF